MAKYTVDDTIMTELADAVRTVTGASEKMTIAQMIDALNGIGSLPDEYQEVEWIKADANVGAYIDLGFGFDEKAQVHMSQYVYDTTSAYSFGSAENSGALRFCLTTPYDTAYVYLYGSNGTEFKAATVKYNASGKNEFILMAEKQILALAEKGTASKSVLLTQEEYTMTNNLYLFAQNYNGSPRFGGARQISYFRYWDKNNDLICNLIPCYRKSDGEIGMYDLARKCFLTNIGTGTFTKGDDVSS